MASAHGCVHVEPLLRECMLPETYLEPWKAPVLRAVVSTVRLPFHGSLGESGRFTPSAFHLIWLPILAACIGCCDRCQQGGQGGQGG